MREERRLQHTVHDIQCKMALHSTSPLPPLHRTYPYHPQQTDEVSATEPLASSHNADSYYYLAQQVVTEDEEEWPPPRC